MIEEDMLNGKKLRTVKVQKNILKVLQKGEVSELRTNPMERN